MTLTTTQNEEKRRHLNKTKLYTVKIIHKIFFYVYYLINFFFFFCFNIDNTQFYKNLTILSSIIGI